MIFDRLFILVWTIYIYDGLSFFRISKNLLRRECVRNTAKHAGSTKQTRVSDIPEDQKPKNQPNSKLKPNRKRAKTRKKEKHPSCYCHGHEAAIYQ
jgi:hypothetical protein